MLGVLGILHIAAHDVAAHVLSHAHSEERAHSSAAALVVACRVDTFGYVLSHVSLLVGAVAQIADGSAHSRALVDDLLAFVAVSGHAHRYAEDLEAAGVVPVVVEGVAHVLSHFLRLGGDEADAVAVGGILVERGAELGHEFLVVLADELALEFKSPVLGDVLVGNYLLQELEGIGDLDRI